MASKKPKEPLVRCGGTMTESAYLAWIRSALRSKSLRWPPRAEALKLARRVYKGPNKQQKWEYQCAICGEWHIAKNVIVDHYPVAAGSILSVDDIGPFANNLYCEVSNLRVLDKVCHDIWTLADKNNISFEQAKFEKLVLEKTKQKAAIQVAQLKALGYNDCSNPEKRKKAWIDVLTKENHE